MKRKFSIAFLISCCALLVYQTANRSYVHGNSFGAPLISGRGFTNSPFDGRACNSAGCHTGTLNSGPGIPSITTDIPHDGYRAGFEYTITTSIEQSGINKFGFQMTAENDSELKSGRFLAGSSTRVPSDFYITQGTNPSYSNGNNSKSWTFRWIAPSSPGSGKITFYAAFNAANNNGHPSGDLIYTMTLEAEENPLSSIEENILLTGLTIYPNPGNDHCLLKFRVHPQAGVLHYSIFDVSGNKVKSAGLTQIAGEVNSRIDLGDLPAGIYFIMINDGKASRSDKLIIR